MSYLKISDDLFLGKQELNRLIKFLSIDGYIRNLQAQTFGYGIIKFLLDSNLTFFKVEQGTNPGTIKVGESYAIDLLGRVIVKLAEDNIPIPNDGNWYWVKIAYRYNPEEAGTVSIDSSGNLTGSGTLFQEVLRGIPNHPSVIKFTNSVNNTSEYEVVEVISNTSAVLSGVFVNETNLKYKVVGTFTPGVAVNPSNKDPFQYDSCIGFTVVDGGLIQSTSEPPKASNFEFFIARVKNNSGVVTIEDKRTEFFYLKAEHMISYIDRTKDNPIIAVESVKWDNKFSTRDKNQIIVGWGLRSTSWVASTSLRQLTFSGGEGGLLKSGTLTQGFTDNDFNGWRCYFKNGKYSKVLTSFVDGSNIKVTLDVLNPDDYTTGDELVLVPDVEAIEIKVTSDSVHRTIEQIEGQYSFNIRSGYGKIWQPIPVSDEDESTSDSISTLNTYFFNLQYRYKVFGDYTDWKKFPDANIPGLSGTGYYSESSFDEYGELKSNPADRTRKTYSGSLTLGFIECVPHPSCYYNLISALNIGDLKGVETTTIDASTSLINLVVGQKRQYQIIDLASFALTQNIWINLDKSNSRNGNTFVIHFKTGLSDYNGKTLKIVTDYVAGGVPPTSVLLDIVPDINDTIVNKGFAVLCTYDGTNWVLKNLSEIQASETLMGVGKIASSAEAIACVNNKKFLTPLSLDQVGFKNLINGILIDGGTPVFSCNGGGGVTVNSGSVKLLKISNKLGFLFLESNITTVGAGDRLYIDLSGFLSATNASGRPLAGVCVTDGAYVVYEQSSYMSSSEITVLRSGGSWESNDYFVGGQILLLLD